MAQKEDRVIVWLKKLPEPYRKQALCNFKLPRIQSAEPDKIVNCMSEALNQMYAWGSSKQKGTYWMIYHIAWEEYEEDPTEENRLKLGYT